MIQSAASEVVAAFLVARGEASRPSLPPPTWPITKGGAPPEGDDWIIATDVSGGLDGKIMDTGETVIHPHVQIVVRCKTYDGADLKIRKICCQLEQVRNYELETLIGETLNFAACNIVVPPAFLFQEEQNRRQVFVTTVQLSLQSI